MPKDHFSHVDTWVFDLDNTLYHPSARLFDQIEVKMTNWVQDVLGLERDRANHLRHHYWHTYGTTLAGLMAEHDIDPDPYLQAVHEIDLSHLGKDPDLAAEITSLPGRKIVYTNGSKPYAQRVLAARGLSDLFDAVYGVEPADYRPKPDRAAFEAIFTQDGVTPTQAAMFEDEPRNLKAPHAMGMRTVHVADDAQPADHIHHHTDDLTGFLKRLRGTE